MDHNSDIGRPLVKACICNGATETRVNRQKTFAGDREFIWLPLSIHATQEMSILFTFRATWARSSSATDDADHRGVQKFDQGAGGILVLPAHSCQAICDVQIQVVANGDTRGTHDVTGKCAAE